MAVNLSKGQKISLEKKDGSLLKEFCVGVNWGQITSSSFFGLATKKTDVDLDLSCIVLDNNKEILIPAFIASLILFLIGFSWLYYLPKGNYRK